MQASSLGLICLSDGNSGEVFRAQRTKRRPPLLSPDSNHKAINRPINPDTRTHTHTHTHTHRRDGPINPDTHTHTHRQPHTPSQWKLFLREAVKLRIQRLAFFLFCASLSVLLSLRSPARRSHNGPLRPSLRALSLH